MSSTAWVTPLRIWAPKAALPPVTGPDFAASDFDPLLAELDAELPDVPLPAIGTSYRLTVDRERGHLYVPTINGLFIYDVNGTNGATPQLLAVWKGWLPGGGT